MRKLSDSGAMSEARRFKTLTLGRSTGSGGGAGSVPQPSAQNQMLIASATPAWMLLTAPAAQGQALITGADPYTPAWGTTFPAVIQFDAGLTFGGATGVNVITVPDNTAQAAHIVDAGATEYMRIITTNTQPVIVFNEGGADVDFRIEASGIANALFVEGSTGNVNITENSTAVRLSGTFALLFVWPEPIVETVGQVRIPWACTVTRVDGNILGGTSCTINIEERGTLGSAGTNILSSDMAADANGESVTSSFNNSALAAGNYLAYDISAVSGAVDFVSITITGTID